MTVVLIMTAKLVQNASKSIPMFERYQKQFVTLPSSINECSTIMIDNDNTDPDIAEPCGGLQCIDGLHCCNLAVGCQQCCSKHHCKRWEKCLYVHFYIKQNLYLFWIYFSSF